MEQNIFVPFNRFMPAPYMTNPIDVVGKFAPGPIDLNPIDVVIDPYAPDPLPPVYLPPIKDYNPPVYDPGPAFRSFDYSGQVRDAISELPLPSATVRIYANGNLLDQAICDSNGNFQITTNLQADSITISEAEHNTFNWPASEVQHTFDLERKTGDLPPVTLPPVTIKKTSPLIWIVGIFLLAKWQKLI